MVQEMFYLFTTQFTLSGSLAKMLLQLVNIFAKAVANIHNVLVIDTKDIYLYSSIKHDIEKIYSLDQIKEKSDILKFREKLMKALSKP